MTQAIPPQSSLSVFFELFFGVLGRRGSPTPLTSPTPALVHAADSLMILFGLSRAFPSALVEIGLVVS